MAVKKWHPYLVGRHFLIRTDHQSLKFLTNNQAITPYQQKWVTKMLRYDFSIAYEKGIHNTVADALSRRPHMKEGQLFQCTGQSSLTWSDIWPHIFESYAHDSGLQLLCQALQSQSQNHPKYSRDGLLLHRKGKIVIGSNITLQRQLFDMFHSGAIGGHSGMQATRQRLSSMVYWKGLSKDVRRWTRECIVCQTCKGDNFAYPGLLQSLPIPNKAWAAISMDFVEGLPNSRGKTTILVVVDRMTKYDHFIALSHPFQQV